ncbi:unnamed protein product [Sphagnum compactum]
MDELFWGWDHEDMNDWVERLTMAAEKYGGVDADDIRMKLDAFKQEPKEGVQKYFERLDKLFQRDRIQDAEQRQRLMTRLQLEIRKVCVVRTFTHIEELVVVATELEKVLGELGETPYEPLKEEHEDGVSETTMEKQVIMQQLNKLCGGENVFSYTRVLKRRMPVEVVPGVTVPSYPGMGIMHLVTSSKTYMSASGVVTQAMGWIDEVPVKVGDVQCNMTFMVVDTDSYDILLGLDFLIKIGAIVDVD